jgi:hypothetical protein
MDLLFLQEKARWGIRELLCGPGGKKYYQLDKCHHQTKARASLV